MTSIDVYIALDTWVPAVISVVLMVSVAITVFVGDIRKKHVPRFFIEMLQLNFPDIEPSDVKTNKVSVEGKVLNPTAVIILSFCVLPLTLGSMFVTFWNVFLVEEEVRGDCVPNFDCYPLYDGRLIQRTPVVSCPHRFIMSNTNQSMSESVLFEANTNKSSIDFNNTIALGDGDNVGLEDVRYECYRFVFLYAEGISAAGGVLLFTAIFSKVYFSILIAVIGIKRRRRFQRVMIGLVWLVTGVLCVLFVVVNTAVPHVRRDMFQTITSITQFLMYTLNLFIIVISGVVVTFGVLYNNC